MKIKNLLKKGFTIAFFFQLISISFITTTGNITPEKYLCKDDEISLKEFIITKQATSILPPSINLPYEKEVFRAGDIIEINGTASDPDFQNYEIKWGVGENPTEWFTNGVTLINNGTTEIINGTLGFWNTSSIKEAGYYSINLTINYGSNNQKFVCVVVFLDPTLHINFPFGWPYEIQGTPITIWSPIALSDINNDGCQEIGFGTISTEAPGDNNYDYVIDHMGNILPGWPIQMYGIQGASLTFSNIDGSTGNEEVIGGMWGDKVYVWYDNGAVMDGWPQNIYVSRSSATVNDIDLDGDLEIILPTTDGGGLVYVWHHNGMLVDGWPVHIGNPVRRGASSTDIDQDGFLEIVFGDQDGYLYVLNHDGTSVDGWPQLAHDWIKCSPVIADIDCDGDLEIIVSSGFSQERMIFVWHHDGTLVDGWPQENGLPFVQPSVGDIDNDGDLEILAGGSISGKPFARFYVWHHDGTQADGWPIIFPWDETQKVDYIYAQPVIGDIDEDGDTEIIVGSYYDKLYAWHHNGTNVTGWPKIVGGSIDSTAAIGDIDNDGNIEIVVAGGDGKVYVWDMEGEYNSSNMEWPMFQHDPQHTGCYNSRIGGNQPPTTPNIDGQISGKTGKEYKYTITGSDLEEDELYVIINWGDNTSSELLGPFSGNYTINKKHAWDKKGNYIIKARAKDPLGWGLWGTLEVTIPKNKPININLSFKRILENHPHIFLIIRQLFGL